MVWSLSHGHIPALAAMAVNIVPPPVRAGQASARGAVSYNHKGPSGIIEVLVNSIEAVSVTVMTIESKWERLCNVRVRRSGRL